MVITNDIAKENYLLLNLKGILMSNDPKDNMGINTLSPTLLPNITFPLHIFPF